MKKRELLTSQIAIIILLLALIRTIGELFRLQYYSSTPLLFADIKPFAIAAMMTSISLLLMLLLYFFSRYVLVTSIAIMTIMGMLAIKYYMLS